MVSLSSFKESDFFISSILESWGSLTHSPQVPDGFISHFYAISEHVSPVLAFGFLGPRQHLSEVCTIFKVSDFCGLTQEVQFTQHEEDFVVSSVALEKISKVWQTTML